MSSSVAPVLVTGALGNVGRYVVAGLLDKGAPVRAADLDVGRIHAELGDSVQAAQFDFTDARTWKATFSNVKTMFLVRPPQLSNIARDMVPALKAAQQAGVEHVVLLSLQGAENNKVVPHAKIEDWLRSSSLTWTFIRPSFFMENLSSTHASDIRDHDEIVVPAGNGRTSFAAAADVAATACIPLLRPREHLNTAYTPTGSDALTYNEVAASLSDVLGRAIRYTKPGVPRYVLHAHRELGMPWAMVLVTTAIYTVARLGKASGMTTDVERVTGRPPMEFSHWAMNHRSVWE